MEDSKNISIYTDGSYYKIGYKEYCGYGIYFPNDEYKSISRPFTHKPISNNRAEIYAIMKSVIIGNIIYNTEKINKITIYSDSEYVIKTVTKWYQQWQKNGKEYKNKDLLDELMTRIKHSPFKVAFQHVRAHTGRLDEHSINNDKVDKLAKEGASKCN